MNSDWTDLLKVFNASRVRFLVVGAHAVMWHTEPRFTKDLDLWVGPTPANGRRVFEALKRFGAPLKGLLPRDFGRPGLFYQLGLPPSRVDILTSVPPLHFSAAWKARASGELDSVPVYFLDPHSLIQAKQAAGRPQDLIDLRALAANPIQHKPSA